VITKFWGLAEFTLQTHHCDVYAYHATLYTSAVQRSYVLGHNSLMPMEVRAPPHYCYYYYYHYFYYYYYYY
jgi:hypothetical protein